MNLFGKITDGCSMSKCCCSSLAILPDNANEWVIVNYSI